MSVILSQVSGRRLVQVKIAFLSNSTVSLAEFFDELERFTETANPDNEILLHSNGIGIQAEEVRLETEEEYDQRIAKAKEHAFRVQQDANRSWKKQQLRFAKARKNK